jgi:hypothetical protein
MRQAERVAHLVDGRLAEPDAGVRPVLGARGIEGGRGGAGTAVQRVSSDLRLNPHFHTGALDGVFVEDAEGGELSFCALPRLTHDDVADMLQIARTRILVLLRRKGVITDDTVSADAKLADSEPALAELAVASTLGTLPAGPALRRREPITLRGDRGLEVTKGLCAVEGGFSLHAATTASASDAAGKEALWRYILGGAHDAAERVQLVAGANRARAARRARAAHRKALGASAQRGSSNSKSFSTVFQFRVVTAPRSGSLASAVASGLFAWACGYQV